MRLQHYMIQAFSSIKIACKKGSILKYIITTAGKKIMTKNIRNELYEKYIVFDNRHFKPVEFLKPKCYKVYYSNGVLYLFLTNGKIVRDTLSKDFYTKILIGGVNIWT